MTSPTPAGPNFPLAEGFTLPALDGEALRIANEVFAIKNYASAPLIGAEDRDRLVGHPYPQRPVGPFACRGFIIHTLQQVEAGIAADTIVAPPPEMNEAEFLARALELTLSSPAVPEADFHERATPLRDIVEALGRTGIPAATGFHIGVRLDRPTVSVASLFVPRVYISKFGARQSAENPADYAVKTTAALFGFLTKKQLEALDQ